MEYHDNHNLLEKDLYHLNHLSNPFHSYFEIIGLNYYYFQLLI